MSNNISRISAVFLSVTVLYFIYWGLGYTNFNSPFYFFTATAFGLFMAFNIGGNDVANSFGTSVGAKTLTIPQALCIAAVFEISGAVIAGGEVTSTIRKGIIDLDSFSGVIQPTDFIQIMISSLIAAALWLLFATHKGLPVSTTHSIIGGIVGSAMMLAVHLDVEASSIVNWGKIGQIAISWIVSPLLGGLFAYLLYTFIKKFILGFNARADAHVRRIREEKERLQLPNPSELLSKIQQSAYAPQQKKERKFKKLHIREREFNAHAALQIWAPMLASAGSMILTSMILLKGLKHMNLPLSTTDKTIIIIISGVIAFFTIAFFAKRLRNLHLERSTFILFSWMQVFTACGFAFSHGSNDIANAVGPFAAILDTIRTNEVGSSAAVPTTVMVAFGVALVTGLWFIGKKVIATVGTNLTKMHPASGFTAELAAATVVMLASVLGLPVSSTHILVGAVLGVGLVNRNANWRLMRPIALAWVVTVPAAAILSAIAFTLFYWFA